MRRLLQSIDATAAKSFPADALYCDACHERRRRAAPAASASRTSLRRPRRRRRPPIAHRSSPRDASGPPTVSPSPKPTMVALGALRLRYAGPAAREADGSCVGNARARAPRGRPAPRRAAQGRRELAAVLAATRTVAQDRHRVAVGGAKADGQRRDAADCDGETLQRRGEGASTSARDGRGRPGGAGGCC